MRASYKSWAICLDRNMEKSADGLYRGLCVPDPPFLPRLNATAVLYLSILMQFQRVHRPEAEEKTGGWFQCTSQVLLEMYGTRLASPAMVLRYLKVLEDAGYIKRKKQGKPPTRYIWINFDKFAEEHIKARKRWDKNKQEWEEANSL